MKKSVLALLSLILASGFTACSISLGPSAEEKQYFVLEGNLSEVKTNSQSVDQNLRVRETEAGRFVDSQRIIFSKDDQSRGYYQFAYWVDAPPKRLGMLLESYIEKAGIFSSVFRESSGVPADFELRTEVLEFRHHIASSPGEVIVSIRAELVSLVDREIVGRKTFSAVKEASAYNAGGAIEAFSLASNEVLQSIAVWVSGQVKAPVSGGLITAEPEKF